MNWIEYNSTIKLPPGWYACHYYWEMREGSFMHTYYYTALKWKDCWFSGTFMHVAGPFEDKQQADEWLTLEENDISW